MYPPQYPQVDPDGPTQSVPVTPSPKRNYQASAYVVDDPKQPSTPNPTDPYWETGEIYVLETATSKRPEKMAQTVKQIKRRSSPSRRQRMIQIAIGFFGAGTAFAVVGIIVGLIVGPGYYRSLPPLQQEIWCNRLAFTCGWKPTPPFEVFPTLPPVTTTFTAEDLMQMDFGFGAETTAPAINATPYSLDTNSTQTAPVITPMAFPTNTPAMDTPTPTETPTPTLQVFTPTPSLPPSSAFLNRGNLRHEPQKWNNCGPTTLTMGLSYFGYTYNQDPAAAYLKPNIEDKNVSPWQIVNYVNTIQTAVSVRSLQRMGGTLDTLKRLLAADFPVIIEKGYEPEGYDWMGHYLLLVGYDDTQSAFYTYDSFSGAGVNGQGRLESYDYITNYWRHFNNTFIVLYPPQRENEMLQILGVYADVSAAYAIALEQARSEVNANNNDKWAWMNMGDALARLGKHNEAIVAFDQAFKLDMPWRLLWYRFTPFESYYATGYYDQVIQMTNTLDSSSGYYVEEAWYYRGLAYASQGRTTDAVAQFQKVLGFNRNFTIASEAQNAVQNGTFVTTNFINR